RTNSGTIVRPGVISPSGTWTEGLSSARSSLVRHGSAARVLAPDLVEPRVPSGSGAVRLIVLGILARVVLVIRLGGPENARRQDGGGDRRLEDAGGLELPLRLARRGGLRGVEREDRGVVLGPAIVELSIRLRRVDVVPEDVEQLLVGDAGRIVRDVHGL